MNKYNNNSFSGAPAGDSPVRFNKRPRYGTNNNGGNGSPRFKNQNHSGYQYSQNSSNATDCYQSNQYEKSSRNLYTKTQKIQNHKHLQQNQSSYAHKSAISSSLSSPSRSLFSAATQNVSNLIPTQSKTLAAQTAPATITAQNNQQHLHKLTPNILDNSKYYGFNYNFFPTYNADLIPTAASSAFNLANGINSFMWQTITSTPPPNLPQQTQPPLPQHQPPPILPPLPKSDNLTHLPPPPPIPAPLVNSTSKTKTSVKANKKTQSNDNQSVSKTIVKMKAKRKSMSMRYKLSKSWCEEDALLAVKAEEANARKLQKDIILIIRFPDPEISHEIVKNYSPDIESVHFQLNFAPRYCLVHLKPGANIEKTIDKLSRIPFGTGFLTVEIKEIPRKAHSTKLNEIDPFTLYVGNLPTTIACKTLKEHFPGAARIDIGFAQRMKYTRYAFIRYQNVQQAIEAYKRMLDAEIGGRSLTIRFRRLIAASNGNKDGEEENHITHDDHGDLLAQTTVEPEENVTRLSQNTTDITEPIKSSQDNNDIDIAVHNSNDLTNVTERNSIENERNAGHSFLCAENNLTETNNSLTSINSTENLNSVQEKSGTLLNIKPDPDIDPDDIVIRNSTVTSHFQAAYNNIKQEEENLALHMEFFEKPHNPNDSGDRSSRSEMLSLPPTTEDTDTMSTASTNSLGDLLLTCQRPQTQENNTENIGPPPAKRNKSNGDILDATVKKERLQNNNIPKEALPIFSNAQKTLKQEQSDDNENLNMGNKNSSARKICSQTNKPVSRLREKVTAANNREDFYNDDIVPPTALFFRTDCQNMFANYGNDCVYDEFYETRASTSLANIKTEPSDISRRRISAIENINMQQSSKIHRNDTISDTILSQEKSNKSCTRPSNTYDGDDDDLVPPQNLLGSYQPPQNAIKWEIEHDDIFSVPFHKTNRLNENVRSSDICNNNDSITTFNSQSNNIEDTLEISNTNITEDNDEDVIIVSDNLKRQSKGTTFKNLDLTNLFLPKQIDLVSFKNKPVFVTRQNREVYKLIDRDNLDRLYDQLDADSDSDYEL